MSHEVELRRNGCESYHGVRKVSLSFYKNEWRKNSRGNLDTGPRDTAMEKERRESGQSQALTKSTFLEKKWWTTTKEAEIGLFGVRRSRSVFLLLENDLCAYFIANIGAIKQFLLVLPNLLPTCLHTHSFSSSPSNWNKLFLFFSNSLRGIPAYPLWDFLPLSFLCY